MKLIDRLMKKICDEMEWLDEGSDKYYSGRIRERLAPVAGAHDAVADCLRDAVSEAKNQLVRLKLLDELGGPAEALWTEARDVWQAALAKAWGVE